MSEFEPSHDPEPSRSELEHYEIINIPENATASDFFEAVLAAEATLFEAGATDADPTGFFTALEERVDPYVASEIIGLVNAYHRRKTGEDASEPLEQKRIADKSLSGYALDLLASLSLDRDLVEHLLPIRFSSPTQA